MSSFLGRSELDISNRALRLVRAKHIASFDEGSFTSVICRETYPAVRDEVLASYPWNCAMYRESLARLAQNPAFGFKYQYQLPSTCLRVWRVLHDPVWVREGNRLLTDYEGLLFIRFIACLSAELIDTWVAKVIATKMAVEIAPALTENVSLTERLAQLYEFEFKAAKRIDAQEGTPEVQEEDGSWVDSRRG